MKITAENFTVIPHPGEGEISILVAGLKIVLDLDEARTLTTQLIGGMRAVCKVERVGDRIARPSTELVVVDTPAVAPSLAEAGEAKPAGVEPPSAGQAMIEPKSAVPAFKLKSASPPLDLRTPIAADTASSEAASAEAGDDKRQGKKLRNLLKALVKEESNSYVNGL
jgi:hypothetical protein